jgi:hypothetical protein
MTLRFVCYISVLAAICASSHAAVLVTSGNLHARATATNNPNATTDAPPDKSLTLPSTGIVADAVANGFYGTSHGRAEAIAGQDATGTIAIECDTLITNKEMLGNYNATATVSGSVAFIENASQTLPWTMSSDAFFASGWVAILNEANAAVLTIFADYPAATVNGTVALDPGNYQIQWNLTAEPHTSVGGAAFLDFKLVPEPSAACIVFLFLVVGARRSRGSVCQ